MVPATSLKHLAVLRRVGLVSVRREGRKRMYHVNVEGLKPAYDWIKIYRRSLRKTPGRKFSCRLVRILSGRRYVIPNRSRKYKGRTPIPSRTTRIQKKETRHDAEE
jgi:DNA-binding transcriptional ArsR family regulator